MKIKKTNYYNITFYFRILLGIIFIVSSGANLFDPAGFKSAIMSYIIMPETFASLAAIVLPWIEFGCGIMLILNIYSKSSTVILSALLIGFTSAIVVNLFRGFAHDCGCFNLFGFEEKIGLLPIIRNMILLTLCYFIIRKADNKGLELKKCSCLILSGTHFRRNGLKSSNYIKLII